MGVLASQKDPSHFWRGQAEVRALIFMLNPHLASEMLKINFHLHLIFLFVIATIVCLNKEVARASLSSSQSSSQSPNWSDTDVNEQGDQARVPLGIKTLPQDCQATLCSVSGPSWLSGERPGSHLCKSPSTRRY